MAWQCTCPARVLILHKATHAYNWATDAFSKANLVLQDTIERVFAPEPECLYADIQRGIYLVRGENVLLLGEIVRGQPSLSLIDFECYPLVIVQMRMSCG